MAINIIRPGVENVKKDEDSDVDEHEMQSEEEVNEATGAEEEEMPEAIGIREDGEDSDEDSDEESESESNQADENAERVYLPNQTDTEGPLECDESVYVFYHEVRTGDPCLSFDIIEDNLGENKNRADTFPLTMTVVAGTQAERSHRNRLMVMRFSNVKPSNANAGQNADKNDSDDDEEEGEDENPILDCAEVNHPGCVNRVKVTNLNGKPIAASWSEVGSVILWDLSHPLRAVNDHHVMTNYVRNNEAPKPVFAFKGHGIEGYALQWSPLTPGVLASGDCKKFIHLWKPLEGGTWHVDQRAYKGHTASVEDIQWSPIENNVMASCSADKTVRIWDIRAQPDKANMLTKENAHESDVNVIHWNKSDPLLLSGGDDGKIKVWDIRNFSSKPAVCTFKHHVAPITSVEWHPTDRSSFAASGADDQLTIWDLSVERDADQEPRENASEDVMKLPPQLLFIHQGQKEIKELHWHRQMPGVVISTAMTSFNIFRTISI